MKIHLCLTIAFASTTFQLSGCTAMEGVSNMRTYSYAKDSDGTPGGRFIVSVASGECWIMFNESTINSNTPQAFRSAADDFDKRVCNTRWIVLNSGGGKTDAAMEIGRLIRRRGYNTSLMIDGGQCSSSCGLLFISGVKRAIYPFALGSSKLGFHQPSRKGPDGKKICVEVNGRESKAFLDFAKSMLPAEAAEQYHKYAMATDCNYVKMFSSNDLMKSGIANELSGAKLRLF